MNSLFHRALLAALLLVMVQCAWADGGAKVTLPYTFQDEQGNAWQVRQDGSCGRADLFPEDGYGKLYTSHGDFPDLSEATFDAARSELILGPATIHGAIVTRILSFDKKLAFCRYVDLFENTTDKEIRFDWAQTYFKVAGGIKVDTMVSGNAQTHDPSALVIGSDTVFTGLVAAGREGAQPPQALYAANKQGVALKYGALVIPTGSAVALLHVQARRSSSDEAAAFLRKNPDALFLKDLPANAVGHVMNFGASPAGAAVARRSVIKRVGKFDLGRGDALDLLELRGGDHCKGTVAETAYRIQTAYGAFDVLAQNVAGIISLTPSGTRQLLATTDGQALAGRIDKSSLPMRVVTHGAQGAEQTVQVPLVDVVRLGYRPQSDEHEPAADRPTVLLRAGDVLAIEPPEAPVRMVTRYGVLDIDPKLIANIVFDSEDTGLHTVQLIDGSHFGALIESDQLPLKLKFAPSGASTAAEVRFPPGTVSRITLSTRLDKPAGAATLKLTQDDVFVGTLRGPLKLDTAIDTLVLDPTRLKRLTRVGEAGDAHMQATFADDTQLSGQLEEQDLDWRLQNGATIKPPVDQLHEIILPQPTTKP